MKTARLFLIMLCWCAATAYADEPVSLSQQAMEAVQQQTREMSALGISEVQNQFQKQNRIRAQEVVMSAAKAGLPTEPVMSKAMEGMAKQVREQQVIQAMETVRSRYANAHQMAKALSENEESVDALTRSIADSMAAGMRSEDMQAVAAQIQTRQQTRTRNQTENDQLAIQTMQTVCTMARLGVHSADVSDTLCRTLQNQYTDREMKQLRQRMAQNSQLATPQQIASRHAGAIGKGGHDGAAGGNGSGSAAGGSGSGSGAGNSGSGSGAGNSGSGSGAGGNGSGSGGSGNGSGGGK